ncbi:MAG TPA: glycosyltransferase family 2 protein [Gaiellaceae bacterium]
MAPVQHPSFDLVVATVDRTEELERLLQSLERQTHPGFRILLVDQNDDDRLSPILARHLALNVERLETKRGLSRARNAALPLIDAELVAFPDDDCVYPSDLLERVAARFTADPSLGGITGRPIDEHGGSSRTWPLEAAEITRHNLWHRSISFTIFLRAAAVAAVGAFDEELGLGSGRLSSSGEETDFLVRALDAGVRIEYDPELVVIHEDKPLTPAALKSAGVRQGASIGYILRKHRYPPATIMRMLVRPLGGTVLALARRDRARAAFHLSTLRGRLRGYRG